MPGKGIPLHPCCIASLLFILAAGGSAADDFSQWAHSAKVVINASSTGANVSDTVTDFPLLIRVRSPSPILSESKSDGSDLRFADASGNALALQIERWDKAAGKGDAWVKVPKIAGLSPDNWITLYWGNPLAVPVSDGSKVFEPRNGFLGVWHLGEPGKQTRLNSVGSGNHGMPVDYVGNESKEGVIGLADSLNGATANGAYLDLGAGFADVTHGFTFSVWAEMTATPGSWERVLDLGNGQGIDNLIFGREGTTDNMVYQSNAAGVYNAGVRASGAISAGVWTNFAFTLTGPNAAVYRNGVKVASGTDGTPARNLLRMNNWLGRPNWSGNAFFKGKLDEPVVSLAARSAGWLKLVYENQRPDSRMVSFQFNGGSGDTLLPGNEIRVDASHRISYPIQVSRAPVFVDSGSDWNPPPRGFDRLGPLIRISATDILATFPSLLLVGDSMGGIALYQYDSGTITWVAPKDGQWVLSDPGFYFTGRDTLPPIVRYLGAKGIGSSTRASFIIKDNVSNWLSQLRLWHGETELPGVFLSSKTDTVSFLIPFGAAALAAQEIRLEASDHFRTLGFPPGKRRLTLSRDLDVLTSPIVLKGGTAWTLAGSPLSQPSATMSQLSLQSGVTGIKGAVWRTDVGAYRILADRDSLPSGTGYWLASLPGASHVVFPPSRTIASDSDGLFPIRLAHGWNMVTSPSLRALPWSYSPADGDAYLRSPIKRLQGFTGSGYSESDSLHPWQGYFVYCHSQDTVIRVGTDPIHPVEKRAAAKTMQGQAKNGFQTLGRLDIGLDFGSGETLRLGASAFAASGLGIEDEFRPPAVGKWDGAYLDRDGAALLWDVVAWKESAPLTWKVVSHSTAGSNFKVFSATFPPGYQAWMVSASRRMKYRLLPGGAIPVVGDDTLDIIAGPSEVLAGITELNLAREYIPGFAVRLIASPTGSVLSLDLPSTAHVQIRVLSIDGKARPGLTGRFEAGYHVWGWATFAGPRVPGGSFIEIKAQGENWSARRTLAILFGSN